MNTQHIKHWFLLASGFLLGQGVIQAINLVTGLLLLRLLSIEEYALYTLANLLMAMASLGSNLGLTSALVTLGSQVKNDRSKLGSLVATVQKYRRQLFIAVSLIIILIAPFMTRGRDWPWEKITLCILLVIMCNWMQLSLALRTGVFDIHHDAGSQWWVGLMSAVVRLLLTVALCVFFPSAPLVLAVNFAALVLSDWVATRRCRQYLGRDAEPNQAQGEAVKRFVYPLAPGVVYYALVGQITLVLLGLFGSTSSIAQVSALANYGRIISMLGLLNGFIVQPYFSRINDKDAFIRKCLFVLGGYACVALLILASSFVAPSWWLLLLGRNYSNLITEMPLAVAIPLLALLSDTLYILLMSKAWTSGQNWVIAISLLIQMLFIGFVGVDTTRRALWLALLLPAGNIVLQSTLLIIRLAGSSSLLLSPLRIRSLERPTQVN
jgi:O-antigen/teichoic acid export membrane protein